MCSGFTMRHTYLVTLVSLAFLCRVYGIYKLCAFPTMDSISCDRVEEGNSNVSCIRVTDSIECADKMKNGLADFALFSANEAVLAGKFVKDYVNVIGEARTKQRVTDPNFEDLVVVVRKPFSGSFLDLRGKGYCHPGVGISHKVTNKILKSFEQAVIQKSDCSNSFPIAEQEIRDLEAFFGPSCRPGRWAVDDNLENKLKRRYRNMCRLCESPSQCAHSLLSSGLERGALDCLTQYGGDVAFVSLDAVNSYFGLTKGPASALPSDYQFLCPNQTVMPINSASRPCIWASQPWDLLVTRQAVSGELQDRLNIWLADIKKEGSEKWQNHLRKLLLNERTFVSRSTNSSLPINQYINRGIADLDSRRCKKSLGWCTIHETEREKCKWVQGATETFGIQPQLECSPKATDKWDCLKQIAQGNSDLVSIPTDDGYLARNVFNLSTLFYEDNLLYANYKIVAVVEQTTSIGGFGDLKNKRACFPEYKGLAWNAFVNTIKQQGLLGKSCPETFFKEACAPGAQSDIFNPSRRKTLPQLCSLCPQSDKGNCSPHLSRKDRTLRALQCLDGSGDVAFINLRAIYTADRNAQLDSSVDPSKYQVLCSNGSVIRGLSNVDDSCALARGVQGEVMGRSNLNYAQESDTIEMLLQLNKWFGTSEDTTRNTMSLYGKYKNLAGLMFEDRTISLVASDDDHYDFVNSYVSLLKNVSGVQTCGATSFSTSAVLSLLMAAIVIAIRN